MINYGWIIQISIVVALGYLVLRYALPDICGKVVRKYYCERLGYEQIKKNMEKTHGTKS